MNVVRATPEGIETDSPLETSSHRTWLQIAYERYERPLVAYALRLLDGNIEMARDCVQDTFVSLCKQDQSHVEGHVDAWLFKTCRNRAMDHHRQEARMTIVSDPSTLENVSGRSIEPAQRMVKHDQQQQLQRQIDRLPKREQEVLALRLGQGLSYKQIAEITDLSVSNVGVLIHQAVTRLRTSLST